LRAAKGGGAEMPGAALDGDVHGKKITTKNSESTKVLTRMARMARIQTANHAKHANTKLIQTLTGNRIIGCSNHRIICKFISVLIRLRQPVDENE